MEQETLDTIHLYTKALNRILDDLKKINEMNRETLEILKDVQATLI